MSAFVCIFLIVADITYPDVCVVVSVRIYFREQMIARILPQFPINLIESSLLIADVGTIYVQKSLTRKTILIYIYIYIYIVILWFACTTVMILCAVYLYSKCGYRTSSQ